MELELGTGTLTMMNRETGEVHDWGEITPMSLEREDWSPYAEPEKNSSKNRLTLGIVLSIFIWRL